MEKERNQIRASQNAAIQRDRARDGSDHAAESTHSAPGIADTPDLLGRPAIQGRGNAPVRAAVLQRMQQTYGNRAVQRYLSQARAAPAPARRATRGVVQRDEGDGTSTGGSTATLDRPQTNGPAT